MQAIELTKHRSAVKAKSSLSARGMIHMVQSLDFQWTSYSWEYTKHKCWDLIDSELCLARLKPLQDTKGVGYLKQQDGGHGIRNPLRSV